MSFMHTADDILRPQNFSSHDEITFHIAHERAVVHALAGRKRRPSSFQKKTSHAKKMTFWNDINPQFWPRISLQ